MPSPYNHEGRPLWEAGDTTRIFYSCGCAIDTEYPRAWLCQADRLWRTGDRRNPCPNAMDMKRYLPDG